jgi:hypothetical protein
VALVGVDGVAASEFRELIASEGKKGIAKRSLVAGVGPFDETAPDLSEADREPIAAFERAFSRFPPFTVRWDAASPLARATNWISDTADYWWRLSSRRREPGVSVIPP